MTTREKELLVEKYSKERRDKLHEEWLDEVIADYEPMINWKSIKNFFNNKIKNYE
jgi:hypothetical protein